MIYVYDRDGNRVPGGQVEVMLWFNDKLGDWDYKCVETTHTDGFVVSTVWLGLDHNHSDEGPPLIFETMVFQKKGWDDRESDDPDNIGMIDLACVRYSTLEQAKDGHEELVFWVAHDPEYFQNEVNEELSFKAQWRADVED